MPSDAPQTRVWVTRDEPPSGPLCRAIRAVGLAPVCEPVIQRRVVADVTGEVQSLGPRDWLVLSSPFAVGAIGGRAVRARVAVVGEASRAAAETAGMRVALMSPDETGAGLWKALRGNPDGAARVLYPRSSLAPIPDRIPGVELACPILYRTEPRAVDLESIREVTIAAVASPSAAPEVARIAPGIRCASIGPTTSRALRTVSIEPWVEARSSSLESLARAIADALSR